MHGKQGQKLGNFYFRAFLTKNLRNKTFVTTALHRNVRFGGQIINEFITDFRKTSSREIPVEKRKIIYFLNIFGVQIIQEVAFC